jgi:predicted dehydrogenase
VKAVDLWLIIGARRWARIVAGELCSVLGRDSPIQLLAHPEDAELKDWLLRVPFGRQIEIVERPAQCTKPMTGVALILNSAYRHRVAIENALAAGYNAVGEKPLTLSRDESLKLLRRAEALGLKLFSTNTYLFVDYLRVVRQTWLEGRKFSNLHLTWSDASGESRHGLAKSYDSSIPIIFDVLPHVACIALATLGDLKPGLSELTVQKGGSEVTARFGCGETAIQVCLSRNSTRRSRIARFEGSGAEVQLDFSVEPGTVRWNRGSPESADPAWPAKRKPIAQMLTSVKTYFEEGTMDDRLSASAALLGNELIDRVADSYVEQQVDFLSKAASLCDPAAAADREYAVKEARSIAKRALPYLAEASPLRRLAASW